MDMAATAARFESLGGGTRHAGWWGFGCEFGFFQRHVGIEPLGLLRWASVSPEDLCRALRTGFHDIGDPAKVEVRGQTTEWAVIQRTYGMYFDHTFPVADVQQGDVADKFARTLAFLRTKLLRDMQTADKLFVYRVHDAVLDDALLSEMAGALAANGRDATLFYVQHATEDHPAFTAVRRSRNLIVGYIDRFAPRAPLEPLYNTEGWYSVCLAALTAWGR